MFITDEAAREYLMRSRSLQAGFKSWGTQVRQAWESTRYEDLSSSRERALFAEAEDLRKQIKEKTGRDLGNPYVFGGSVSQQAASIDVRNKNPGPHKISVDDFWDEVDAIAQEFPDLRSSEADLIHNIATKAEKLRTERDQGIVKHYGGLADFIGSTGALMSDEVNIASMMFGGSALVGARATLSQRLMSAAGREALIGMGAEASIQPYVARFKNEIGVDHDFWDAISNIAQAGAGGAGFAAVGEIAGALAKGGIRKVRDRWSAATAEFPDLETPDTASAREVLEGAIAAYDYSPFKEGLVGDMAHEAAMTTAMRQLLAGEPIELRQVFEGLKKIPETKPVKVTVDETGKAAIGDAPIDGDAPALDLGPADEILQDDAIARMFDTGKEPPRPRDVLAIIREMGGIEPSGELRGMDLQRNRPGLVRKNGKNLGEIREHLEEIGMIDQGSADSDVFDLIDDALRGNQSGAWHPEDFDRAVEWEAWRDAQSNADIYREAAFELRDAARAQGRELSSGELTELMRRADPRAGDDLAAVAGEWINEIPADTPANRDMGAQILDDIDWQRTLDGQLTADDAAAAARKAAIRRAPADIDDGVIAAIEKEGRERFTQLQENRPAGEYSPAEIDERIRTILDNDADDLTIVDPENFDAEGNPVEVSARDLLARSDDEIEDAALIAACIMNKVA